MNNIIIFPIRRRRGALRNLKMKEIANNKKMKVIAGIFSTVFIVTLLNMNFFTEKINYTDANISQSRGIASIDGEKTIFKRNEVWERKLASKLSKLQFRKLASVGVEPTLEEKLRVQELEGKYLLKFKDGKIEEINFAKTGTSPKPSFISDPKEFIFNYRDLMPGDFSSVKKVTDTSKSNSYSLYKNDKKVADIDFDMDNYGRLLNMKVYKNNTF